MKCSSCNAELKPDAKFCGNCGAKVQGGGGQSKGLFLAPNPLGLAPCAVKVIEVTGEGPDKDGDVRVELKYEVTNKTNEDWDYLVVRVQLLDSHGQVVEETRDTQEQTIAAGDSAEFDSSLWGVKFKALGPAPEKASVLVSAIGCALARQKLGEMDVPAEPFQAVQLPRVKVGDVVQLVSGSLWKTEIDSDKDSRIEVKALVQNLTALHLHEVKVIAEITDKAGREITDVNGSDEVRPGDICVISGSGYAKDKLFKGAKAALALSTYFPVATGIDQHTGVKISAPEVSDEGDEVEESESDDHSDAVDLSQRATRPAVFGFSVRREYRLTEGALTSFAESLSLPSTDSLKNLDPKYGSRSRKTEAAYKKIEKTLSPQITIALMLENNISHSKQVFGDLNQDILIRPIDSDARLKDFKITSFGMDPEDDLTRIWIEIEFKVQLEVLSGLKFDGTDGEQNPDLDFLLTDLDCVSAFSVEGLDDVDGVEDLLDDEATYQQAYEVNLL